MAPMSALSFQFSNVLLTKLEAGLLVVMFVILTFSVLVRLFSF